MQLLIARRFHILFHAQRRQLLHDLHRLQADGHDAAHSSDDSVQPLGRVPSSKFWKAVRTASSCVACWALSAWRAS